jgi:predicted O-methyltransferase YrrM
MLSLPHGVLAKLRENMREYGFRETVERSYWWGAEHLLAPMLNRTRRPPLCSFSEAAAGMHFPMGDLATASCFPKVDGVPQVRHEFEALWLELAGRYSERTTRYPQEYGIEQGSAFLLYALVRILKPNTILETGVANGHSSFFILNALRTNGAGLLHSIDRSTDVGELLDNTERQYWRLHVLSSSGLKKSFLEILETLPALDLFLHDSDHTYAWQAFELDAAFKKLAPGGIVACDDCDSSYAFLDFCREAAVQPTIVVETRKIFGLVARPPRKVDLLQELQVRVSLPETMEKFVRG